MMTYAIFVINLVAWVMILMLLWVFRTPETVIVNSPLAQRECLQSLDVSRKVNTERWGMYEQCSRQLNEYVTGTLHLVCWDEISELSETIEMLEDENFECFHAKNDICRTCTEHEAENWEDAAQERIEQYEALLAMYAECDASSSSRRR